MFEDSSFPAATSSLYVPSQINTDHSEAMQTYQNIAK
jgi:hypothetical protein